MEWHCPKVASARANLWSCADCVAASEQIASITPAISLELAWEYSGEWYAEYEGPGIFAAAEVVCGGDGGERSGMGVLYTSGSGAGFSSTWWSSAS